MNQELETLREELRDARDLIVQLQRELERAYEVLAHFRAARDEGRCADDRA